MLRLHFALRGIRPTLCQLAMVAALAAVRPCGGAESARPQESALQPTPANSNSVREEPHEAKIKQLRAEIEQRPEDKLLPEVLKLYQESAAQAKQAENDAATAERLRRETKSTPGLTESTKAELAALPAKPQLDLPEAAGLEQLNQELLKLQAARAAAATAKEQAAADDERRAREAAEIPQTLSGLTARLSDVEKQLAAPAGDEPSQLVEARRQLWQAQKQAAAAAIERWQAQQLANAAAAELAPLLKDLANRRLALADDQLKLLNKQIQKRRLADADAELQQARQEAAAEQRAVHKELAAANLELAEARTRVVRGAELAAHDLEETKQLLALWQGRYDRTREKIEKVGLTNAIGLLLRRQRDDLPSISEHRHGIAVRQRQLREAQSEEFNYEDQLKELDQLEQMVAAQAAAAATQSDVKDDAALSAAEADVRRRLETRREYLTRLLAEYNRYFTSLEDLDFQQHQLIQLIARYDAFIDEHVLWIRSEPPIQPLDAAEAGMAAVWLLGPTSWRDLAHAVAASVASDPVPLAAFLLLALTPYALIQGRLRRKIRELGEAASHRTAVRFAPTLAALLYSLACAAFWPAWLGFGAWVLARIEDGPPIVAAVGYGLQVAAIALFPLELFRQMCRKHGLGETHFLWPHRVLRSVRRQLRLLILIGFPLVFVAGAMNAQPHERFTASLGRLAFSAVLVVLAVCMHGLLRPHGAVMREVKSQHPGGWFHRLRYLWYGFGVVGPLALAALALAGYYYTALQLAERLQRTAHFVLALMLAGALVVRWLFLSRRRLAIAQRRQQLKQHAESNQAAEAGSPMPVTAEEQPVDLSAVGDQTLRLMRASIVAAALVGLWIIWVDVFPALGILNKVELWETSVEAARETIAADGRPVLETTTRLATVTLANLALSLVIVAMTFIAARNVPGLLQIAILQHLPIEPAVRYAIDTVARYLIVVVGLVLAFSALSIGWSKVQWLVAAISVGLGFGLQEIFANFVSGLIILFERPIRVGDVVTIGDTTGVVSRIRIRATTITNWERKELVVPNKEFITGRLLNWTLSDKVNRVQINVGVAYGTDTDRAQALLLEIVRAQPAILDDPPPRVTLEGFGDSTLDFVVRAFLGTIEQRLDVIHELHSEIHRRFQREGIEISFRHLDVHVHGANVIAAPLSRAA